MTEPDSAQPGPTGGSVSESDERYRRLVELSPDAILVIQDGYHVFANPGALRLLGGNTLEDLQSQPAVDFMHPGIRDMAVERLNAILDEHTQVEYADEAIVTLQGRIVEIESSGCAIQYGGRPAALVVIRDISDRKAAERAQRRAEQRFRSAFRHAPIGMAILDLAGFVVERNDALAQLLGADDDLAGCALASVVHPDDRPVHDAAFRRLAMRESDVESTEVRCVRSDGETLWVRMATSAGPEDLESDPTFVVQMQDVTAARTAEARLMHQAMHDPLTDLPNRLLFMDRLAQAVRRGERDGLAVTVLFCDLDLFKDVNDSYGHAAGDHVIQETARRLRRVLRPADTVARLGGDEFAVLIENSAGETEATIIARRVAETVGQPIDLGGTSVAVTVSIGIALAKRSADPEDILGDADAAMYAAKTQGRSAFLVYDESHRREHRGPGAGGAEHP